MVKRYWHVWLKLKSGIDSSKAHTALWWLSAAVGENYLSLSNAWLPLSIEREKGTFGWAQSSSRPRTQPRGYINNIDSMVSINSQLQPERN